MHFKTYHTARLITPKPLDPKYLKWLTLYETSHYKDHEEYKYRNHSETMPLSIIMEIQKIGELYLEIYRP